jgi:hypothetical protein
MSHGHEVELAVAQAACGKQFFNRQAEERTIVVLVHSLRVEARLLPVSSSESVWTDRINGQ